MKSEKKLTFKKAEIEIIYVNSDIIVTSGENSVDCIVNAGHNSDMLF